MVTPLYKGNKNDLNSYRGIFVLPPTIAKIFEKILAKHISIYLNLNNILYNGQHGFRIGHSWKTALYELTSDLNINRNQKLINSTVYWFWKAFGFLFA